MTSELPSPRRIVISHDPTTGAPSITDDKLDMPAVGQGPAIAYVQTNFIGDPKDAHAGSTAKPDTGFIHSKGVCAAFEVDVSPGQEVPVHYVNSQDYVVMITGELELGLSDGSWMTFRAGDLMVNVATAHAWKNTSGQWARMLGVALPCQPQLVNGKPLDEEPVKAHKLF